MKTLLVTGTPGTGKSLLAQKLTAVLIAAGHRVLGINLSELIKKEQLYDEYDPRLDTYLIDDRRVRKYVQKNLASQENYDFCILETHTVSAVPRDVVNLVVVLSCRTDVIYDRLVARGYSKAKVDENVECEIMRIVLEEAHEHFPHSSILEVSSNTEEDLQDNIESIIEEIIT